MTDNEIIKALDICGHLEACADCPLGCLEGVDKCMHTLLLNALDLINRQKAELERYKKYYETMEIEIYSFRKDQAEVKFLKNKIRAEAIKEFAERLKEAFSDLEFEYDPKVRTVKVEEVKSLMDWALHKISIETIQDVAKDIFGN